AYGAATMQTMPAAFSSAHFAFASARLANGPRRSRYHVPLPGSCAAFTSRERPVSAVACFARIDFHALSASASDGYEPTCSTAPPDVAAASMCADTAGSVAGVGAGAGGGV